MLAFCSDQATFLLQTAGFLLKSIPVWEGKKQELEFQVIIT